ncbi:MAG: ATP-binding protein [Sphingomonas sp.]
MFAVGTVALLLLVEQAVSRYATEVASDSISAEVAVLREEDQTTGTAQTVQSIVRRENAAREHQLRYLLVGQGGQYLAGSLPASIAQIGWHTVTLPDHDADSDDGATAMTLMALGAKLDDGTTLVVASDTSDLNELRQGLVMSSATFGLAITLLALIGGFGVGTVFLRRLDRVNRSVERIMHGSFGERLPTIGMSPEFDQLSANLNRMLERIEALMDGMRQVSTDIAHDLRTPLTHLHQRLEAIKADPVGTVSEQQIDAALAQVDKILGIFHALLRISALEAGAGQHRIAQVDLSALVSRVVEAYRPVVEDAEHVLADAIQPDLVGRADPEMLTQAVANLIENAIIHTPPGSRVFVALERREDGVAIVVADDGKGIPAGERERVLERFYRLDGSRNMAGAGLGLALVSAVAAIHGASLRLSDNDPGLRAELLLFDVRV